MKILWHSVHPEVGTGYGSQTALFTPRIRDLGHDVAISAYYGLAPLFGVTRWNDMLVYPSDHTGLNKFMLRAYAEDHAQGGDLADVQVITLMDVWTWISMRHGGDAAYDGLRMAAWVPIDHMPVPPNVGTALKEFKVRPIAMSKFGRDQLAAEGFDPLYVPHGVDTSVFKPADQDRAELRRLMGLPEDAFVVGMVANNQGEGPPRKAFPQVIQAFAALRQKHEDAVLYLHCDVAGIHEGVNLAPIIDLMGIPHDAVAMVPQSKYMTGTISPARLAKLYSAMDVLVNPSYGEGFGIPIVEAQACGTPVIVTDWTSMPELCGAGWKVEGDPWYNAGAGSFYMYAPIAGIYSAMEAAYDARRDQRLRDQAVEFAQEYDADHVLEMYWKPALEALDVPVPSGKIEVPDVTLNRAQRRELAATRQGK